MSPCVFLAHTSLILQVKGTVDLFQYLEEEIITRGLDAQVSSTGCLKVCDRGPAMVVYPAGW
ncbi:MAG: (2Fe-2S) ferredoxin domain-containing protein [Sedimentisphaerales bacterium]|nr:(2Fe-2S) ferredoxin domain-containing protein [Sedimentisphaerales bacterium]